MNKYVPFKNIIRTLPVLTALFIFTIKGNSQVTVKELQEHVKKVTAPYKYPRIIEFVEELPKTISGKIRRVEIRQRDNK